MSYYVSVPRISGRAEFIKLVSMLEKHGYGSAEYADGGWYDYTSKIVHSHLRFDIESDAMAYALSIGATYSTSMPTVTPPGPSA